MEEMRLSLVPLKVRTWESAAIGRRLHDLRHTAACLWLTRGVDLSTVSAWLGHASISTANRLPALPRNVR